MSPFDPEAFLRATLDEVWNGGLPGRLYECTAAAVAIHGPSGQELLGCEEAVAEVVGWLAAFPAARFAVEEVIWSGDEQRGYLASVRYTRRGVNLGASIYGPATGRPAVCAGISHFFIHDSLIREVWQAWDEVGLIAQLGLDLAETLERLSGRRWPAGAEPFGIGEVKRSLGQLPPAPLPAAHSRRFDVEDFLRRGLHDIWNRRLVGRIDQVYAGDLAWQLGNREPAGRDDLAAHVLARLSAVPDLRLHLDQLILQGDDNTGYRTAIAWTLLGTLSAPSPLRLVHQRIHLHGLSQQRIEHGRIVAEWTACDELGLAAAMARHSGNRTLDSQELAHSQELEQKRDVT